MVLILDAETRSALAALRSLSRRGIDVVAGSSNKNALSFSSRMCTKRFLHPHPGKDRKAFIGAIEKFLKENSDTLCMSFTDITTDALRDCADTETFGHNFVVPQSQQFFQATNKRILAEIASSVDIPTPEEINPECFTDPARVADITYPVIIKPARSVSWKEGKAHKDTARVIHTAKDLLEQRDYFMKHASDVPLTQKMLSGDEFGVSVLADHGVLKACFAHRRLRSITPHGGVSTLRESIFLTEEMKDIAEKLTKVLEWNGVMMIELKRNNETGRLTLIEINARFWGSLFLAIQSGVDFPYLLYLQWSGRGSEIQSPSYTVGTRARHLITDFSHFYALRWGAFSPKKIKEFFTFFGKNLYFDVWSLNDPLPGFVELFQFMKNKL